MSSPHSPSSPGDHIPSDAASDPTEHPWSRPETTEGSIQQASEGDEWSVVPKSSTAAAKTPQPPPMPTWVKVASALAALVLLGLASVVGLLLGAPSPEPSPSPSPTVREWPIELPQVLGEWVSAGVEITEPMPGTERVVYSSNYSDGEQRVALVASRPEEDLELYLDDAGVGQTELVGQATCGYYEDTGTPLCVRIIDNTGLMLVGLDTQAVSELSTWLDEFAVELAGPEATMSPSPSPSPEATES